MTAKLNEECPCPFCGDKDDIHLCIVDVPDQEGQPVRMQCGNCGAGGPVTYSRPHDVGQNTFDAMREWNKRNQWKNSRAYSITSRLELVRWINFDHMTTDEKAAHPKAETTGGHLKTYTYHEAWANLWATLTAEEKAEFGKLPNFDAKKFLQITGIKYKRKTK